MFQKLEEIAVKSQEQSHALSEELRKARNDAHYACEDQRVQARIAKQSIDTISTDTQDLKNTIAKLMLLSKRAAATATSAMILGSLQYPLMDDRHQLIEERHPRTLSWIFKSTASPFKTWLEQDSGAFWISGKAGSGKSTLMKYVNHSSRAKASLKVWSGKRQLFIASFYF